jgi:hypothetical protein
MKSHNWAPLSEPRPDAAGEYGTRDLFQSWSKDGFVARSRKARGDLTAIQRMSDKLLVDIRALRNRVHLFEETYEYQPIIMQDLTGVDADHPSNLTLPESVRGLSQLFRPDEP